jgi:hypothetical protein
MAITNKIKFLENINDFSKVGLIYLENSGENLLRYYLEKIFQIKTGSNIKKEYLNINTNEMIFPADDDVDSNWIIASNYPSRNEEEYLPAEISYAILLIRNPVDLIMSKVLGDSIYYEDAFNKIDEMIDEWKLFHKYWINAPIPVHLVRYEDLLLEPDEILKQLCKFLLGNKSIENTKLEYVIKKSTSKSVKIDKKYLAFDVIISDEYKKFITADISEKIQQNFLEKLTKMLQKYNYELNSNGELLSWMANHNRESLVKMVEFHENLNNQYLTATYTTIKLC